MGVAGARTSGVSRPRLVALADRRFGAEPNMFRKLLQMPSPSPLAACDDVSPDAWPTVRRLSAGLGEDGARGDESGLGEVVSWSSSSDVDGRPPPPATWLLVLHLALPLLETRAPMRSGGERSRSDAAVLGSRGCCCCCCFVKYPGVPAPAAASARSLAFSSCADGTTRGVGSSLLVKGDFPAWWRSRPDFRQSIERGRLSSTAQKGLRKICVP